MTLLTMITATNLRKHFGLIEAVSDISLEIRQGETFGLLGPNGAGKSTTINMLCGLLVPDSGSIKIDGAADPTKASVRRRLGLAPQALALYDELTGEENVRFFGSLYGLPASTLKDRVAWALDFVGLADRRQSRAKTYSGGMQRRLNLACALVHDPPVLLLDEPTVGVDPQSRNVIFERIEQLKADGRTILYTTHYMEEAERLCDRVAIIDHGKILAMDAVTSLIREHGGDSIVQGDLDSPPQDPNRLPGRVTDGTHLRIETKEPLQTVSDLATSGYRFRTLTIQQADLETVFLNLTGRSLRD
ncbi:MAG: ABC transporter ATP-binding protein [bacterium]